MFKLSFNNNGMLNIHNFIKSTLTFYMQSCNNNANLGYKSNAFYHLTKIVFLSNYIHKEYQSKEETDISPLILP